MESQAVSCRASDRQMNTLPPYMASGQCVQNVQLVGFRYFGER